MNFPGQIPVADLNETHPEFDGDHLECCHALYHGGRIFREKLNDFLVKRKIEEKDASHYKLRKARSFYVPYAAGLIDWIAAAAMKDGLELRVVKGNDEQRAYYESLSSNADGKGTPLASIATHALLNSLKYGRSYLFPDFLELYSQAADAGSKDARIALLDPRNVDDWELSDTGTLAWARMHTQDRKRSAEEYKQPKDTRDVWTFFDGNSVAIYENTRTSGQAVDLFAKLKEIREHGIGTCPVFEVHAPENIWVLDRIFEVAVALFNREASLTWALDMSAYATLVLHLDGTQISELVASELAALKLQPAEGASYIAPPGGIYEPLFKDADRLKSSLYEVVRSLGINAANVPQAGRMSGETISKMREPLDILLESFSRPVIEAFARLLDTIREHRGDDDVELELVQGSVEIDHEEEVADGEAEDKPATDTGSDVSDADRATGDHSEASNFRDVLDAKDRSD